MTFLEKDLEDIIETTPVEKLIERGLPLMDGSKFLRQVTVGNYGRIDLIAYGAIKSESSGYINPHLTVLELKQDKIGIPALTQLSRYLKGLKKCSYSIGKTGYMEVGGMLIGRSIDFSNDFIYLAAQCDYQIQIFTYEYSFD